MNTEDETQIRMDTHATEVVANHDLRATSEEMKNAKRRINVKGSLDRGTFMVVGKDDIPADASVFPSRLVLHLKTGDGHVKYEARFVIGGHRDIMKNFIVHQSQIHESTIRFILALTATHWYRVWTSDDCQAYL